MVTRNWKVFIEMLDAIEVGEGEHPFPISINSAQRLLNASLTTRASALPEGSSDAHNLLDLSENVVVAGVQRLGEGVVKANAVVELHV